MTKDKEAKIKYWFFLEKKDAENVRVLAEKAGLSFSAYVRQLIKKDLEENSTRTD